MALTEDAILETAERLLAETERLPTVEQVREALGGGSFSTIKGSAHETEKIVR